MSVKKRIANRWEGSVGSGEGRVRVLFSCPIEAQKWVDLQKARRKAGLPIERPNGDAPEKTQAVGRKKAYSTLGELVELATIGWRREAQQPWERELLGRQLIDFYGRDKPIAELLDETEHSGSSTITRPMAALKAPSMPF